MSVTTLSAPEQEYFGHIDRPNWLRKATILVTTSPVTITDDQQGGAIVAVCDRPFDNVPERMFGKAPLTHAVAYADGTTGLLSVDEFQRLDLSQFVDVRTIPGKKVEPRRIGASRS